MPTAMETRRGTVTGILETEVDIEHKIITPELARELLGDNVENNRGVRPRVVQKYAHDMANGNWRLTGETLKFDPTGLLIDGQHRLHAVITAGVSAPFLIARGIPMEAMISMDDGAKRTFADHLKLMGETCVHSLSTATRMCWAIDQGLLERPSDWANITPSNSDLRKFFTETRDAVLAASHYGTNVRKEVHMLPSVGAGMHFLLAGHEEWEEFSHALRSGEGLMAGSPVLALRRHLLARDATQSRGGASDQRYQLALCAKAFRAFVLGDEVTNLRFRRNEQFPIIPGTEEG